MRPMTMEEVRLDTAKAARFSASALSTGAFDALPPTQSTIYRCPRRPKAATIAEIHPESGECRMRGRRRKCATPVELPLRFCRSLS
jgi:hypothetical protein